MPDGFPADEPRAAVVEGVKRLRTLAKVRVRHWRKWRPGISNDQASGSLIRWADTYADLLKSKPPAGVMYLHLFLPDMYSAPITRISLWATNKRAWKNILTGSLKPRFEEDSYYRIAVPFSSGITPAKIRLETWGYGGQGVCYAEIITKKGRFVPDSVEKTSGIVRDAGHILSDDQRWTWLGNPDV